MIRGKVKWYDKTKGFGFISSDSGEDVFVHKSQVSRSIEELTEGQSVTFEVEQADKGPVAIDVKQAN